MTLRETSIWIKTIALFAGLVLTVSCERDVLNVIDGNNPPEDPTVSFEQRDRYIERVYITLLGRKPDSTEHQTARTIIDADPLDSAIRYDWLTDVIQKRSASVKRWEDVRSELLESADTMQIYATMQLLIQAYNNAPAAQKPIYQIEIDRLNRILYAADSLQDGVYSNLDLHRFAVDNLIYDDINMGSENFVVSVFDHFLYRYPTQYELTSAKRMVEGFQDVLFLQNGSNKGDFLDIFFSSDAYAEGQVRYIYLNYLFREPSTTELQDEKVRFQQDLNFRLMQARILTSDEYFNL